MLPLGLKISWFILSSTGLLSCWVTLWSFGRVVGTKWASIVYCLGTTFAQGIFCLGIVYRMDPFLMARPFCLAQNVLMSSGGFINMGAVFALTLATSMAVRKPKTWGDARRALRWQNFFFLPVVLVPVLATTSYLAFSFSFGSVGPSEGMWCETMEPEWVRFLGPSGIPFLLSIPVLYFSIKSFLRIRKTNLHLLRSRPECPISLMSRTDSQHATRRKNSRMSLRDVAMMPVTLALTISKKSSVVSMRFWKGVGTRKSGVSMNAVTSKETKGLQREHYSLRATRTFTPSLPPTPLPLAMLSNGGSREFSFSGECSFSGSEIVIRQVGERTTPDVHDITLESRRSPSKLFFQDGEVDLENSNASSGLSNCLKDGTPASITKSSFDSKSTSTKDPDGEILRQVTGAPAGLVDEAEADVHRALSSPTFDTKDSNLHTIELVATRSVSVKNDGENIDMRSVDVEAALAGVEDTEGDSMFKGSSISSAARRKRSPASMIFTLDGPYKKPKQQPAWLAPTLWHVILFQFAFVFIQFLGFLTTFVEVVSGRRTPYCFGSQHLALLLAAWCPVVVFGSLPVVRRNLLPWRPISIS